MKTVNPTHWIVAPAAILSITVVELFALSRGIDGTALAASVGAIGTVAGYAIKHAVNQRGRPGRQGPPGKRGPRGERG